MRPKSDRELAAVHALQMAKIRERAGSTVQVVLVSLALAVGIMVTALTAGVVIGTVEYEVLAAVLDKLGLDALLQNGMILLGTILGYQGARAIRDRHPDPCMPPAPPVRPPDPAP